MHAGQAAFAGAEEKPAGGIGGWSFELFGGQVKGGGGAETIRGKCSDGDFARSADENEFVADERGTATAMLFPDGPAGGQVEAGDSARGKGVMVAIADESAAVGVAAVFAGLPELAGLARLNVVERQAKAVVGSDEELVV